MTNLPVDTRVYLRSAPNSRGTVRAVEGDQRQVIWDNMEMPTGWVNVSALTELPIVSDPSRWPGGVLYSHAAPHIRAELLQCVANADQTPAGYDHDRLCHRIRAMTYCEALRIMTLAADQHPVEGIAGEVDPHTIRSARALLTARVADQIGIPSETVVASWPARTDMDYDGG